MSCVRPTITPFAREAAAHDGEARPYLVFLQGGPGSESPRPNPFRGRTPTYSLLQEAC